MPDRPPAGIYLHCTVDGFDSTTWTEAWTHQQGEHAGVSPSWELLVPPPSEE